MKVFSPLAVCWQSICNAFDAFFADEYESPFDSREPYNPVKPPKKRSAKKSAKKSPAKPAARKKKR